MIISKYAFPAQRQGSEQYSKVNPANPLTRTTLEGGGWWLVGGVWCLVEWLCFGLESLMRYLMRRQSFVLTSVSCRCCSRVGYWQRNVPFVVPLQQPPPFFSCIFLPEEVLARFYLPIKRTFIKVMPTDICNSIITIGEGP